MTDGRTLHEAFSRGGVTDDGPVAVRLFCSGCGNALGVVRKNPDPQVGFTIWTGTARGRVATAEGSRTRRQRRSTGAPAAYGMLATETEAFTLDCLGCRARPEVRRDDLLAAAARWDVDRVSMSLVL